MRKDAFILCLTTVVLSAFGFFLRWLQNMNAFEPDTGLAIAGAKTSIAFIIYSLAALALLIAANRLYLGRRASLQAAPESLHCPTVLHKAVLWLCAVVSAIAWLVLMFTADKADFPTLQRVTAALGILASASLPFIFPSAKAEEGKTLAATAAIIPVLFCCVWLVCDYRVHSENPVLWQYVIEVLAVVAVTMSFYYVAAWFYGKAKPHRCLVAVQLASYLCLCTLTDEHSTAEGVLFAAMAVLMLAFQFVIIENAKKKE